MRITTMNTVYTLQDMGDGAFKVVNREYLLPEDPRNTTHVLPVGTVFRALHEPQVGASFWGEKLSCPEGAKLGTFATSKVREIEQ